MPVLQNCARAYVSPGEKRTRRPPRTFRLGTYAGVRFYWGETYATSRPYVSPEETRTPQLGFSWGVRFAWGETYAPPAPYVSPQEKRTPADPQIEQAQLLNH